MNVLDIKQVQRMINEQKIIIQGVKTLLEQEKTKGSPEVFYFNRSLREETLRLDNLNKLLDLKFSELKVSEEQRGQAKDREMKGFLISIKNNILARFKKS